MALESSFTSESAATAPRQLTLEDALAWIPGSNALVSVGEVRAAASSLSVPVIVTRLADGTATLESHLPRSRGEVLEAAIHSLPASFVFRIGEHYVDPHWIRRPPHAPTETKLVFELRGRLEVVPHATPEAIQSLDRVRLAKQQYYQISSPFKTADLESAYLRELLAKIFFFRLVIQEVLTHQLMALQHLDQGCQERVIRHLESRSNIEAQQAVALIRHFGSVGE
jgi:predicted FMN-binding regulatory protein PaiB